MQIVHLNKDHLDNCISTFWNFTENRDVLCFDFCVHPQMGLLSCKHVIPCYFGKSNHGNHKHACCSEGKYAHKGNINYVKTQQFDNNEFFFLILSCYIYTSVVISQWPNCH